MKKVDKAFYLRPTVRVAAELLGKSLCVKNKDTGIISKHIITETEAYCGEEDTACHAHKGRTARTQTLYEEGGIAYVYLCYGIHYLLNIVTEKKDFPSAVLIRALQNFKGPGRLTKALGITKVFNGLSLIDSDIIWLETDNITYEYTTSARVGIDYATKEYREMPWRFILNDEALKKIPAE